MLRGRDVIRWPGRKGVCLVRLVTGYLLASMRIPASTVREGLGLVARGRLLAPNYPACGILHFVVRLPTIGALGVVMPKVMLPLVMVVRLAVAELLLERDRPLAVVGVSAGTQRRLRQRGGRLRRFWRLPALESVPPFGRT